MLSHYSCLTLCDPMDYTCQSPLSMEFSRQEYWSGLTFPSPWDHIEPTSPASPVLQADSLPLSHQGIPIYMCVCVCVCACVCISFKVINSSTAINIYMCVYKDRISYLSGGEILILFWKGWKVSIDIFYFFQFLQN